jgi:ATP:corrinoid adenosyltransferase
MWKACNLMTKVIEKIDSRPKSEKELRKMKQGISQIFRSVGYSLTGNALGLFLTCY